MKYEKEQIQICTANILERKQQASVFHENINKLEDESSRMLKQNKQSKDNCEVWKPTYMLFAKHEENLQEQLQNLQFASEKDKKMYQDHVSQYKDILKQHQVQHAESMIAQEYYKKKAELDELQSRVQMCTKKCKQKECTLIQLLEPAPFQSLHDWTLKIASLRVNTQETLQKIISIKSNSSELERENTELQKEIEHSLKLGRGCKQDKDSELRNVKEQHLPEEKERSPISIYEEKGSQLMLEKEKLKQPRPPSLSIIPQKLVRPLQSFKLSWQSDLEREKPLEQSKIIDGDSRKLSSMESEKQGTALLYPMGRKETPQVEKPCTKTDREREPEERHWTRDHSLIIEKKRNSASENSSVQCFQTPTMAGVQEESQFRLVVPQRQTNSQKWFHSTATITGNTEVAFTAQETACQSKESAYESQVESFVSSTGDHPDEIAEENQHIIQGTPESSISKDEKDFCNTPEFQMNNNTGCEETASKSPFSFLMVSTPKTPTFNLFSPSVFGTSNTPDQMDIDYSSENINPATPQKDLGSIFGKMDVEDDFTFSFPSEPSSHTFGAGKDDFSFPFSFGQDRGALQSSGFKDFQSSESTKQFTFF